MMPGFARSIFSDMRDSWDVLGCRTRPPDPRGEVGSGTPQWRQARIPGGRDLLKGREGSYARASNCGVGMRGIGRIAVLGLVLLAACSGGGGGSAASTSTTTSTSTTLATTTTLSQKEAVKAAYLAYWKMIDRLAGAPDPNDPELTQ